MMLDSQVMAKKQIGSDFQSFDLLYAKKYLLVLEKWMVQELKVGTALTDNQYLHQTAHSFL